MILKPLAQNATLHARIAQTDFKCLVHIFSRKFQTDYYYCLSTLPSWCLTACQHVLIAHVFLYCHLATDCCLRHHPLIALALYSHHLVIVLSSRINTTLTHLHTSSSFSIVASPLFSCCLGIVVFATILSLPWINTMVAQPCIPLQWTHHDRTLAASTMY